MSKIFTKRLMKELSDLQNHPPAGVVLEDVNDLNCWKINILGAKDTLYEGEIFTLKFSFSNNYPIDSPEVVFINHIPVHPHVCILYNGHICLSILYDHWSPALTVSSVCLSIISMLSSCTKKVHPIDNDRYVLTAKTNPKLTSWEFSGNIVIIIIIIIIIIFIIITR
ncbi:hypothetical protein PIROE2DRAFT_38947 [Piromyces sp. E2]|nr:hypothetical protein PIROE2DRAFT_38947 [Piromyces sp. E2]|eukprot:OUM68705.1 hypothetical protein PIROE2DRAFT_38947 [Piromyces sp. E2]